MIYELRRGGFALFLRINHSGTLYSQWDTGFSGFVGRDSLIGKRATIVFIHKAAVTHSSQPHSCPPHCGHPSPRIGKQATIVFIHATAVSHSSQPHSCYTATLPPLTLLLYISKASTSRNNTSDKYLNPRCYLFDYLTVNPRTCGYNHQTCGSINNPVVLSPKLMLLSPQPVSF